MDVAIEVYDAANDEFATETVVDVSTWNDPVEALVWALREAANRTEGDRLVRLVQPFEE